MSSIFITATGTDRGKTHISCLALSWLRKAGITPVPLKPVMTGVREGEVSDARRLLQAAGQESRADEEIARWCYAASLSADRAAQLEGQRLELTEIVRWCQGQLAGRTAVIEGIGGVMSPLNDMATNLDLMEALNLPVVLVCGTYLGAISHTLTALASLDNRHITPAALVVNSGARGGKSIGISQEDFLYSLVHHAPLPLYWLDEEGHALDHLWERVFGSPEKH